MPTSSTKLQEIMHQVDAKTSELAALLPMKPEDEARLWEKFRLEWNYASNHIEGNTLTYQETELLLKFDQLPTEPHTLREVEEMKAHDVAVALVKQWAADSERELSEADIRALNETILVRPFWKDALTPDGQSTRRLISVGVYKEQPNSVRLPNGEMFHYVAPEDVPREMGELMDWYRTEGQTLHPVVTAALLHYRFVRIHPFDDGNGRISRLLLNYHLLRKNLPPVIIKSEDKRNYLFALQKADVGDLDAFCVYVGEQALWSLELSIKAAKGESVEEKGDWEKELELLIRRNSSKHAAPPKMQKLLIERYYDSIKPLVEKLEIKLSKFDSLFHIKEIIEDYEGEEHLQFNFSPKNISFLFESADMEFESISRLSKISWNFSWRGYKFGQGDSFDLNFLLVVWFKDYRYRIFSPNFDGMPNTEKPYNVSLGTTERDDLIEKIGKTLSTYVKQRAG
jgi:Fic family protein